MVALGAAVVGGAATRGAFDPPVAVAVGALAVLAAVLRLGGLRLGILRLGILRLGVLRLGGLGFGGLGRVGRPVGVAAAAVAVLGVWAACRAMAAGSGGGVAPAGSGAGPASPVWSGAGLAAPGPGAGLAAAGLGVVLAAALLAAAGLGERSRRVLRAALLGAGLLVAVSGWAGVAWQHAPLALPSSGLWRASSTLTYANATAAFLVVVLLLVLATTRGPDAGARAVTVLLLAGLLATASRAGIATLALGLAVLACSPAGRSRLAGRLPGMAGGLVAALGLLPGMPVAAPPCPGAAVAALVAGLATATAGPVAARRRERVARSRRPAGRRSPTSVPLARTPLPRTPLPRTPLPRTPLPRMPLPRMPLPRTARARATVGAAVAAVFVAAVFVAAVFVAAVFVAAGPATGVLGIGAGLGPGGTPGASPAADPVQALDLVSATRLSADSPERDDLAAVAARQFRAAPLAGVGPGGLDLVYVDHLGRLVAARFVHEEYLQTAAETGVVGAGLAVTALGALLVAALRRLRTAAGAGAAAILAAFAVHSAFDFLWHIPVLPLLVVAAAVPLLDPPSPDGPSPENEVHP